MVFDGRSVTSSPLVEPVCGVVCGSVGLWVVTTPTAGVLVFAVVRSVTSSPLVEPVCGIVCGSVGLWVVTTPSTGVLVFAVVCSNIWLDPLNVDIFRSVVAPLSIV